VHHHGRNHRQSGNVYFVGLVSARAGIEHCPACLDAAGELAGVELDKFPRAD